MASIRKFRGKFNVQIRGQGCKRCVTNLDFLTEIQPFSLEVYCRQF